MSTLDEVPVVELNNKTISLKEVLKVAISKGNLGFIKDAIHTILINDAAIAEGISISEEELQKAADDFRQQHKLQSAEATREWFGNNLMTADDFEARLNCMLLTEKLKHKVTSGQQEQYFAEHSTQYQSVSLSQIVVKEENLAREILSQIEDEEQTFEALARKHSIDLNTKPAGGYIGQVNRQQLSPVVQTGVFGSNKGDVIGPFKTDQGFHIIRIEDIADNTLNEQIRQSITEKLFSDYVSELYNRSISKWKLQDSL